MSSTDNGTDAAETPELPPTDTVREEMLATLQAALGDAILGSHVDRGDLWVRVANASWKQAAQVCKEQLACDYFCFLSGLDWLPNPVGNAEKVWLPAGETIEGDETEEAPTTMTTGLAGGDTRFQVFARLYSTTRHWGVTLKADLDDATPTVESIVSLYRGADWHERETWEMYGFEFEGHPRLRHLYLPGEFEGYPLRKDFPLLSREVKPWPGLVDLEPMPGDAGGEGDAEGGEA